MKLIASSVITTTLLATMRLSSAFVQRTNLARRFSTASAFRSNVVSSSYPSLTRLRSTTAAESAAGSVGGAIGEERPPVLITTPIYYVNDKPHIGHAYTTLACDVLARWYRMEGRKVHFLTGTDEHGQKVQEAAVKAGVEPQAYVDDLSTTFQELLQVMAFSNDAFVRTTSSQHKAAAQELWRRLEANGQIYLGAYEGWYSVRDECYYTESELTQEGKAPTGSDVEWVVKENSFFFKLSEWEKPLLAFYEANPNFIAPESRRNEVVSFVKGGLRDLSVSRTKFDWGVAVPSDSKFAAELGGDKHVMYVWVDALANYISALGWGSSGDSSPDGSHLFDTFWPQPNGGGEGKNSPQVIHMVGKDILRFHGVYWPALLMAAGLETPTRLFAHGWWTRDGAKISKSVGNVIDPKELVETFGVDQVRYFLMSEVPFGSDGDYSERAMLACANGFLANALGNLQMRVMSLIFKNCGKAMPSIPHVPSDQELTSAEQQFHECFTEEDRAMLTCARTLRERMQAHIENQALHKAAGEIDSVVRMANKYIDEMAPWALKKTDEARMRVVLWVLADALRHVAICATPFMPAASNLMLDQLGVQPHKRDLGFLATSAVDSRESVPSGTEIAKPTGLFPRIELPSEEEA
mmetsp:Transcript_57585/g.115633  ORF Transcript_57585/g.115633 Transcript_57585/m.115633 type:complete len:637 (-) Transcript_57585:263-2173(-)